MSRLPRAPLPCVSEEVHQPKSRLMPDDPEFSWSNSKHLKAYMKLLVHEVRNERNKRKKEVLKSALFSGRDEVLSRLEKSQSLNSGGECHDEYLWQGNIFNRLPSNTCTPNFQDTTSSAVSKTINTNLPKHQTTKQLSPEPDHNKQKSTYPCNLEKCENSKNDYVIKLKGPKNRWVSHPQSTLYIEGTHRPRPLSSATVFLKTSFATEDNQNLTFVPYFGDDDKEDVVSELFDIKDRETMVDLGAGYQQNETYDTIDEVLRTFIMRFGEEIYFHFRGERSEEKNCKETDSFQKTLKNVGSIVSSLDNFMRKFRKNIASLLQIRDEYVVKRFNLAFPNGVNYDSILKLCNDSLERERKNTKTSRQHGYKCEKLEIMQNPLELTASNAKVSYEDLMDSYRSLFCRRCFSYDCNIHGNLPTPDSTLQCELAMQKESEGGWNDSDALPEPKQLRSYKSKSTLPDPYHLEYDKNNGNNKTEDEKGVFPLFCSFIQDPIGSAKKLNNVGNSLTGSKRKIYTATPSSSDGKNYSVVLPLSNSQKSLIKRAFCVFRGDIKKIASALRSNYDLVSKYIQEQNIILPDAKYVISDQNFDCAPKRKKARYNDAYYSMKNYNCAWLKRVQEAEIHPSFLPCDHTEPCSEKTCSCIRNAFFCTKHCIWGQKSRNFFRGCNCKAGHCRTKSCSCFAAKRECDPDLCRTCGACTDEPDSIAKNQRCRNDNIGMRRHCHLLLAESSIKDAGWGLYTKNALKKGDFVHEYIGEIISQEEAERRGRIYDKVNRSYLFNLSSDYVVDASRKGNKTKFANHSSKPNCYTRMVSVNGDIRIGLFAKEDIEPQSELFFDYRYDVTMDNDLLIKPGKTVDWMKNPKMANKISKKYAEGELKNRV